tara:strand:+ start:7722 stop:8318 length:597 start_codon:yes stop_codon:yes gene_type:complete
MISTKSLSSNLSSILQPHLTTFFSIVLVYFINGPSYPFIGNLIWLPLGVMLLCFLLFDFKVVLAVFLATVFSDYWFHAQPVFSQVALLQNIASLTSPILAISSMRFFKLSNFFDGDKVVFQHLLFLAILTALFNTLIAFFTNSYISSKFEHIERINATAFIKNYLIGDLLGCLIVLFFAALVIVPAIRYLAPKSPPLG